MARLLIRLKKGLKISGNRMLLIIFLLVTIAGCSRDTDQPGPQEQGQKAQQSIPKVTIGIQVSPAMTLVMVAKEKGHFLEEGVDVEIKEFTAGKFALQAFLGGAIDFAVSGEVPVCLATLQGNQIRVVAQVVEETINEVRVVALKEEGMTDPTTYFKTKKRKLATSFGGGPEFFTYEFLRRYEIEPEEIEVLSLRPEDMPAALEARSVDAIAIFDPFAFIAEKRMGDQVTTFSDASLYSEFYVLDARPEQVENNPEVIEAILRGLVRASHSIEADPDEAKQILQGYTKLDRDIIDGVWGHFSFKPALTQKLIDYWNAQAIWAKDTGKVQPNTEIPNFRGIIDDRFLQKVNQDAVNIS